MAKQKLPHFRLPEDPEGISVDEEFENDALVNKLFEKLIRKAKITYNTLEMAECGNAQAVRTVKAALKKLGLANKKNFSVLGLN